MSETGPYKEVKASSIPPGKSPDEITYDDLVTSITDYLDTADIDLTERQFLDKGNAKGMPTKLTMHRFISGLNGIILDYIRTANKNNTLQHNTITAEYFNGVNSMSKVLDNVDIKVADTQFLCYIIGYIFKMLKHFKENNQNI
jgi:hypothetical protein